MGIYDHEGEDYLGEGDHEDFESKTNVTEYICEDCDYRWTVSREIDPDDPYGYEDIYGDDEDTIPICPMCGSAYVSRI